MMARHLGADKWSASVYSENARYVSELGAGVLAWLAPQPGEHVLDLGCGDGVLSTQIGTSGAHVVGVDASESMIAAALGRGVDARLMDGEGLSFDHEFDAVFSNAALHWMLNPRQVISGVRRALRAGGRFVGEMGGHGNIAAITTALRAVALSHGKDPGLAGPWFFPAPDEYRRLLEIEGFTVRRIQVIPRPTPLPSGLQGWLETFCPDFFQQFSEVKRRDVIASVETLLAPSLRDYRGRWHADYVRLRFEARLGR